jgi:hypothetical protein
VAPVGAYVYLRSRQTANKIDVARTEAEGRKAWLENESGNEKIAVGADGKNYGVPVGRSGGGV